MDIIPVRYASYPQIGATLPVVGFYTMGEICPLPTSSKPIHHVSTFVTVLIGEEVNTVGA